MVQKCILAENSTFSQRQKLNDQEFFGGKLKSCFTSLGVIAAQINDQIAKQNCCWTVTKRPPHDGTEIRYQFTSVKWFGQITIGAAVKRGDFLINAAIAQNNQYREKDVIFASKPR